MKREKLRLDEVRRWAVIMVQQIVRVRLAQRAVMKKRRVKEEAFRLSAVREYSPRSVLFERGVWSLQYEFG